MVIKDNTNPAVERHKARLGLTGDVYIINGLFIESLESHKQLLPASSATTIEEAEQERIAYEAALDEERAAQQAEQEEDEGEDDNADD